MKGSNNDSVINSPMIIYEKKFHDIKLTSKIPSSLPSFPFTPACTYTKKKYQESFKCISISVTTQCCIARTDHCTFFEWDIWKDIPRQARSNENFSCYCHGCICADIYQHFCQSQSKIVAVLKEKKNSKLIIGLQKSYKLKLSYWRDVGWCVEPNRKVLKLDVLNWYSCWFAAHLYSDTCLVWEAQDVGNWKPFPNVTAILQSCQHTRQKLTAHSTVVTTGQLPATPSLNHRTIKWSFMHHCQIFLFPSSGSSSGSISRRTVTTITAKNFCSLLWVSVLIYCQNDRNKCRFFFCQNERYWF